MGGATVGLLRLFLPAAGCTKGEISLAEMLASALETMSSIMTKNIGKHAHVLNFIIELSEILIVSVHKILVVILQAARIE